MKKILTYILLLALTVQLTNFNVKAEEISNYAYSQNDNYSTTSFSGEIKLSDSISGTLLTTNTGLAIINNQRTISNINTAFPVIDYLVVEDLDNDGVKDILTIQKAPNGKEQVVMVSSKTSNVLYQHLFQHKDGEQNLVNSRISDMSYNQDQLVIVYDYTIVGLDLKTGKQIFEYQENNNIWKIAFIDNQIVYTMQDGIVGSIDQQGKKLWRKQIVSCTEVYHSSANQTNLVKLNAWDIITLNEMIYVMGEDNTLTTLDMSGNIVNQPITLNTFNPDALKKQLGNNQGYDLNYQPVIKPTGILNRGFMSQKFEDNNENYLLISSFLGDQQTQGQGENLVNEIKPSLALYDLKNHTVKQVITLDQYNLSSSNALMSYYDNQEVIIIPTRSDDGQLKISIYQLESGELFKEIALNIPAIQKQNEKIQLSPIEGGYLLQSLNNISLKISEDFKSITYLNQYTIQKEIADLNDYLLTQGVVNGMSTKIQKIETISKNILYTTSLPENLISNSKGFESIVYNKLTNQIATLVNEINTQGEVKATHIILIDANDGKILKNQTIKVGQTIENNQNVNVYLMANKISFLPDLNRDGSLELLVDETILDGKSLEIKSYFNQTIVDNGLNLNVGDVNHDQIDDVVTVLETEATLYLSKVSGTDISYEKTNKVLKYTKDLTNHLQATTLPDLDGDGIFDFVINAKNSLGHQIYQVIDPSTFNMRYELLKEGVTDAESSFLVNEDLNQDGVKELIYNSIYGWQEVIDGKDGKVLFEKNTQASYGEYYRPDPHQESTMIAFNFNGVSNEVVNISYNDANYIAWLQTDYNEQTYRENTFLFIANMSTYEIFEKQPIITDSTQYGGLSDYSLITLKDTSKLVYYNENKSIIYDYQNKEVLATYQMKIAKARMLEPDLLKVVDLEQSLYQLDLTKDFTLTNLENQQILPNQYTFKWETSKNGVMNISIDGNKVASCTNGMFKTTLLEGNHTITFAYDNGYGKVVNQSVGVKVKKQKTVKMVMILLGVISILGFVGIYVYPQYKLKKKVRELND